MGVLPLKGRTIEVLSKDEVLQMHKAVLDLLVDPGVKLGHDEALDMGNTWNSRESGALARTLDDTNADRKLIHHRHHLTRLQHQGNGVAMADNASTRRPNASPHTLAECP